MGWEERSTGRYYYRKVRRGGQVVSEYVGNSPAAERAAEVAERERAQAVTARARDQAARARLQAEEAPLDELGEMVGVLATAMLLAAGCHTHKGTWRRAR